MEFHSAPRVAMSAPVTVTLVGDSGTAPSTLQPFFHCSP
jgi:hypothetical protein